MMLPEIEKFRQKYPEYNDMDDSALANNLAKKFPDAYGDLPGRLTEEVGGSGTMPFVNRGIAAVAGAPVDLLTKGLNIIPGVDIQKPVGGRQSIERGMEAIGAVLPEEGRKPETISEHVGDVVGQTSAMMAPIGGATQVLSRGTGLAANVSKNILSSIGRHPYLTMLSELTGGVGAGAGRGIAEETVESPAARSAIELGGGLAGGMAPVAAAYAPAIAGIRAGKNLFYKVSMPFSKRGSMYRAGEYTKGLVADPEKTISAMGQKSVGDLPPALRAGEKRLATLYKSLVAQDPVTDADTIEEISRSIVTLEKEMRKMGYGSPEVLSDVMQKRVAALELGMDKRVAEATARAKSKIESLPVSQRQTRESTIVRNELHGQMQKERGKLNSLWDNVPKDYRVGAEKTRGVFAALQSDLATAQQVDIPAPLKQSPIIKTKDLGETTLREMQGLRSKLLETARIARKDGKWNKSRIAEDVSDAILEDLGIAASGATSPEAASLQAALAATRQFKTRFESGVVGKILGYSKSGAPAIDPSLTLDISIGRMGAKGAVDLDKVAITPEAVEATKRYLARSFSDYSLDKTGTLNTTKADRWIKTNEDILDNFPELRTQMADAATAQELAAATQARMAARKAALQDPKVSTAARFLNAADLNREVNVIFKDKNPTRTARDLVRKASKDETGAAVEGLRAGVIDHVLEKASVGAFNDAGEQTLSGRAILNFINRNNGAMKEIFTPEQISRMRTVGDELAKIERFEKSVAGKTDIEMKDFASNALRLFSRVAGARLGGYAGRESAGGSLQMAQIASGRFKTWMNFLTKNRAEELVHDAILSEDPKLLQALLQPLDKPQAKQIKAMKVLDARMNAWLAGTGSRVFEDIMNEANEQQAAEPAGGAGQGAPPNLYGVGNEAFTQQPPPGPRPPEDASPAVQEAMPRMQKGAPSRATPDMVEKQRLEDRYFNAVKKEKGGASKKTLRQINDWNRKARQERKYHQIIDLSKLTPSQP